MTTLPLFVSWRTGAGGFGAWHACVELGATCCGLQLPPRYSQTTQVPGALCQNCQGIVEAQLAAGLVPGTKGLGKADVRKLMGRRWATWGEFKLALVKAGIIGAFTDNAPPAWAHAYLDFCGRVRNS